MKRFLVLLALLLATPAAAQNTFFAGNPGDMIYRGTTAWQRVPGGTAGQLLMSNGPTAAPFWTFDLSNVTQLIYPRIATNRVLGNVTGGTASPVPITISQWLDTIGYDTMRPPQLGALIYKDAVSQTWQALSPGGVGFVLRSNGPTANPSWAFIDSAATPGVAGTCLVSNGVGVPPTYQACVVATQLSSLTSGASFIGDFEYVVPGCGNPNWYATGGTSTVTITIASPGVIAWTNHGLEAGMPVFFTTTGVLPTPIASYAQFYVKTVVDPDHFTISSTSGGTAIDTSGGQSGTHTAESACILQIITNSGSSTNTIYEVRGTGGGAGGCYNKGGGGAGGTVTAYLSGIPAGGVLQMIIGSAGYGCNSDLAPRTSMNGTPSKVLYNGLLLMIAEEGHLATNALGGAGGNVSGCSPNFLYPGAIGPCIIQAGILTNGGDGAHLGINGSEGGASYYGGGCNKGGCGGADGSGGGWNPIERWGFDGFHGQLIIRCTQLCGQ